MTNPVVTKPSPEPSAPQTPYPAPPPQQGPARPRREDWVGRRISAQSPTSAAARTPLLITITLAACAAVLLPNGLGGLGLTAFVLLVIVGLIRGGVHRPQALAVLGAAGVLALTLLARESGWLRLGLTGLVIGCLVTATLIARHGSIFDSSFGRAVAGLVDCCLNALLAPVWLIRGTHSGLREGPARNPAALARILLVIVPVILLVTALLASADEFFASLLLWDIDSLILAGFYFIAGGLIFASLLRTATVRQTASGAQRLVRVTRAEATIALGGIAIVLAAFVAVQIFAEMAAGQKSLSGRGISAPDLARTGYIQLLIAAAVVVAVVVTFDRIGRRADGERFGINRALSLIIVALSLCVAGVAVKRLSLYCDEFGLTMLRVACVAGAVWIVMVLLMLAVNTLGFGRRRNWLPGAAAIALVVVTLGLATINPQRAVVEYNLAHSANVPLDLKYLTSMSSDAVPSLVAALPTLSASDAEYVKRRLCRRYVKPVSWTKLNLSRVRAEQALEPVCPR